MQLFKSKPEDKWNTYISKRIKEAREERSMSQEDLAKAIYKNRVTISDYERGRTEVSASDLQFIALALEKPITFFYPDLPKVRGVRTDELTDREKELIQLFRRIQNEEAELLALQHVKRIGNTIEDIESEAMIQAERMIDSRSKQIAKKK
ncbi:MAG: helix-turn-helix domain-containing protein [Chloroflexota bacterium]|nr:MAG: helix-turn-helix domain-containing protein [Chloroflexota bacterium]